MDLALVIIAVWIMSTCFHEFGHAITAYWGGDKSVKDRGYLTLNPFVYINSATTLVIPVIALMIGGIALPGAAVIINTGRIKSRFMQSLVSFAGPLFTLIVLFLLVGFLDLLPSLKTTFDIHLWKVLLKATNTLIYLHVFVFILNMLPLPPLDGFGILEPWLPAAVRRKAREFSNIGFLLLMGLFFFCDPFAHAIQGTAQIIARDLGADWTYVRSGFNALQQNSFQMLAVLVVAFIAKGKMRSPNEKANDFMNKGKFSEALPLFEAALATNPADPRLLIAIATCLLSLGRKEEALPKAENAVALEPDSPQACGILALCLSDLGQSEKALEMADRAIKCDTASAFPFNHIVRANSLNNTGRFQEALEAAEIYLARERNPGEALVLKAAILENLDRNEDALGVYNKAARSPVGKSLHMQIAKGLLLCTMSRAREGIAEFDKFLPNDPAQRDPEIAKLKLLLAEKASGLETGGKHDRAEATRQAINDLK